MHYLKLSGKKTFLAGVNKRYAYIDFFKKMHQMILMVSAECKLELECMVLELSNDAIIFVLMSSECGMINVTHYPRFWNSSIGEIGYSVKDCANALLAFDTLEDIREFHASAYNRIVDSGYCSKDNLSSEENARIILDAVYDNFPELLYKPVVSQTHLLSNFA
jgi:hypothetical protein